MHSSWGLSERLPARRGELLGVAGDPMDPDQEVGLAEFDAVVCVFRRPDVDGERDRGDDNQDEAKHGEYFHSKTPLSEMFVFCARIGVVRFEGIHTSRQRLIARWWSKACKPGMPCARPVI